MLISDVKLVDDSHDHRIDRLVLCLLSLSGGAARNDKDDVTDACLHCVHSNDERILDLVIQTHVLHDLELHSNEILILPRCPDRSDNFPEKQ